MIPGVTFHPRESWQDPAKPIRGPRPYVAKDVLFGMAHYTADDDLPDGDPGENANDLPQYLRNAQAWYLKTKGYSLGYSFAVDWLGGVWEMRGFDYTPAANDGDKGEWEDPNLNHYTVAVLYLVDGDDRVTDEAAAAGRAIYKEAWRRTLAAGGEWRQFDPKPHKETDYTLCPGVGITLDIRAGRLTFDPNDAPDPTPPEETDVKPIAIIKLEGDNRQWAQWPGFKHWLPDPETRNFFAWVYDLDTQTVNRTVFKAAGPVVGPNPDSRDGFGVPK